MAKKARTQNPEQTRGALLEAASDEIARFGFDGALVTAAIFRKLSQKMVWNSLGQAAIINWFPPIATFLPGLL